MTDKANNESQKSEALENDLILEGLRNNSETFKSPASAPHEINESGEKPEIASEERIVRYDDGELVGESFKETEVMEFDNFIHEAVESNSVENLTENSPQELTDGVSAQKAGDDRSRVRQFMSNNKEKLLKSTAIIISIIILAFGSVLIYNVVQDHRAQKAEQQRVEEEKAAEEARMKKLESAPNPLAILSSKNNPQIFEGELTAIATNNEAGNGLLTTNDGVQLYIKDSVFNAPVINCTVSAATDFCLAARATMNKTPIDIFLVKDFANTRLAEDPKSFKEVKTEDGSIRATMILPTGDQEVPVAAISKDGAAGYLYFFPVGTDLDIVNKAINNSSLLIIED